MEPKLFNYGETITYLKFNGDLTDEVEVNNIVASPGYGFAPDSELGVEGSAALQLTSNKNVVIKNIFNVNTPVYLTVPTSYTLQASTTSFWIKQYSTSEYINGYHPIKIVLHALNEEDEDVYFTYTNKTQNTFDIEIINNEGEVLESQSIERTTEEEIVDNWLHVAFITYKGTLTENDGTLYDGYILDLFVDGIHNGFVVYEGNNLPIIDKLVDISITGYDTGENTGLSNGAIADLKIVNKLEYYPTQKSTFVPEEVDNGTVDFVYRGTDAVEGLERKILYRLHHTAGDPVGIVSKIAARGTIVEDYVPGNEWVNNNNLITGIPSEGKVYDDAVYFSGNKLQGYILDRNILWGLTEFTIAAWVKNLDNSKSATLLEIVPPVLMELTEDELEGLSEADKDLINTYKSKYNTQSNSINVNIYDTETVAHGVGSEIANIEGYNVGGWNYITTTFKNNVIRLFVNGKLIQEKEADLELDLYNKLSYNMYSIIGASFVDDLSETNNSSNMYMDDFIIYDKALFTKDFEVPQFAMVPFYNSLGMIYDLERVITEPGDYIYNTERYVAKTYSSFADTKRIVLNPAKYIVFRISV